MSTEKKNKKNILVRFRKLINELDKLNELEFSEKIDIINQMRNELSNKCPLRKEPVDNLQWIKSDNIIGNDYNPNNVAPPEMKLLFHSIKEDGYTQPIVAYYDKDLKKYIIIDGFHRSRVGKEYNEINERVNDYLPIVVINKPIAERMASTIRHNRARGTHEIQSMSQLVAELHLKGWSDKKISTELGMEKDEILRLKQFTGLGDLFRNRKFSKSWI